jgi:hypothetical protein
VSNRNLLKLTPDLTTRWATGNDNFVYSSLWDFKSSFTCRKILGHGTFPLYFPSERKVCCGFLSPLKIHRLGRVLNPQPLGPVASTLTTTAPRRLEKHNTSIMVAVYETPCTIPPRNSNRNRSMEVKTQKNSVPMNFGRKARHKLLSSLLDITNGVRSRCLRPLSRCDFCRI